MKTFSPTFTTGQPNNNTPPLSFWGKMLLVAVLTLAFSLQLHAQDHTSGSSTFNRSAAEVKAYPNPCRSTVMLEIANFPDARQVEVLDATGQFVSVTMIDEFERTVVDMPQKAGIYFLRVVGDETQKTVRVVRL